MAELKPCPFCGGDRLWTIIVHPTFKKYWWKQHFGKFYIECRMCHYCGETKRGRRRAIEAWNRRYTPPTEIDFDYGAEDE